uniref:Uncharacterized protein n=1 Tax=Anopheles farauti TaxID=69004 RepID=A0A182QRN9_9DIPT
MHYYYFQLPLRADAFGVFVLRHMIRPVGRALECTIKPDRPGQTVRGNSSNRTVHPRSSVMSMMMMKSIRHQICIRVGLRKFPPDDVRFGLRKDLRTVQTMDIGYHFEAPTFKANVVDFTFLLLRLPSLLLLLLLLLLEGDFVVPNASQGNCNFSG